MNKKLILDIVEAIQSSEKIYIGSHVNPDGDNLGSSLAIYLALKKLDKDVSLLKVDDIPDDYLFLKGIDEIQTVEALPSEDYTFIALDSADMDRLGRNKKLAENAKILINIDHHGTNPGYGDINFVDPKASASGELVYYIIESLDIEMDEDIATCIYTAISSDTGSFMYSNTSAETHRIISNLFKYCIDINEININLYQSKSLEQVRLFSAVMDNLESYFDRKLLVGSLTKDIMEKSQASSEDSEGLVEEIRNIKGVEISILLKEEDDNIRVSMRSKEYVDLSKIASNFGGGGHARAAGCTIYEDIETAKKLLIKELEKEI